MQRRSETFYLIIPDRDRRAACFAILAAAPQRIVRGFNAVGDFLDEQSSLADGVVVIDLGPGQLAKLRTLLLALAGHERLTALVVADTLGVDDALALIRAGVRDIVPATVPPALIASRAEALMPVVIMQQVRRAALASAHARLGRLSPRERSVLTAIADGLSNKEIARSLSLSPRTVEVHRANIMRRAEAASLAELLRLHFLSEATAPLWRESGA